MSLTGIPSEVSTPSKSSSRRINRALMAAGVSLLLLAGCGGSDGDGDVESAAASRVVTVTATEYSFAGDPGVIAAGDTIGFEVENVGRLTHSMQMLNSDGRRLGETGPIQPGDTAEVTITFEDAGSYTMICDIDDHLSRGQRAGLTVVDG